MINAFEYEDLGGIGSAAYLTRSEMEELEALHEIEPEIIPPDDRRPVLDTTAVPFRWICHLVIDFGYSTGRGSGTLISPRHILTAGHNLIKRRNGIVRRAQRITVTPAHNCAASNPAPFGSSVTDQWVAHERWVTGQHRVSGPNLADRQFEYGLITLKTAIGDQRFATLDNKPLGFWGSKQYGFGTRIRPRIPSSIRGMSVNISGYPSDKCCLDPLDPNVACPPEQRGGAQFRAFGNITNPAPAAAPLLMLYNLDTVPRNSGAPVWIRWQDFRNLVAVHTGPGWVVDPTERLRSNRGVRITEDVMNQLQAWTR
jgi:V8-like Glu-specific endopeptidase